MKTPALKLLMNTKIDEKIHWVHKIMSMPLNHAPYVFYPRVYRVDDVGENVILMLNLL